jgi:hypothetical protein
LSPGTDCTSQVIAGLCSLGRSQQGQAPRKGWGLLVTDNFVKASTGLGESPISQVSRCLREELSRRALVEWLCGHYGEDGETTRDYQSENLLSDHEDFSKI